MNRHRPPFLAAGMLAALLGVAGADALRADSTALPQAVKEVGFDQNLGAQVPLDLRFRDESGREVRLGDYFGEKPVVIALVYYECPMLCTLVLNGLESSLRALELTVGGEFEVVTVSFDPTEKPALAAAKKATHVGRYGRAEAETGWHFLTGDEAPIRELAAAVGFRYTYDAAKDQYAHPAGIVVTTPDGRIARYFYGADYPPRDLRLGLVEASEGRIGGPVDQLLLLCYHYDPETGRYNAAIWGSLRVAGAVTVLAIVGSIVLMVRRDRRARRLATISGEGR